MTETATVVDENSPVSGDPQHEPMPGIPVNFAVTGAGQATAASGVAVTDTCGKAFFSFIGP